MFKYTPSRILRHILWRIEQRIPQYGKVAFIQNKIPERGKVLDVGCGNNSPQYMKTCRPDIYYVGLDIGIYNQMTDPTEYADEFILTDPENFASEIRKYENMFDVVISTHNLEHCNEYRDVLMAMIRALGKNGLFHLVFPCEASVNFPSRKGTLNFYDDPTHKNVIPYQSVIDTLEQNGLKIVFARKRFRPLIPFLVGLICEPYRRFTGTLEGSMRATWALYGFETLIVAKKE